MDYFITILRGVLGIGVLILICYLLSANRKAINWRLVGSGIALQLVFAILVLKVPYVSDFFEAIASVFTKIIQFSDKGANFLFGETIVPDPEKTQELLYDTVKIVSNIDTSKVFQVYVDSIGGNVMVDTLAQSDHVIQMVAPKFQNLGYIFAFRVLPTVLFYSALSSVLYYFGILQKIVYGIAWVMNKTMRLSGPESLAAAANVFIGQTEAPLFIKPYLPHMTRSEILCLMCGGMATIAGGVFAAYVGFLGGTDPAQQLYFAKHLLAASLMSAPAAIVCSKILQPETQKDDYSDELKVTGERTSNLLDAIATGTTDGLKLAINVGAMLLVFTGLVYMCNYILENSIGDWTGLNEYVQKGTNERFSGFNFTYLLGIIFAPLAWVLGTPWADTLVVGQLLGQKTVLNEFVAYLDMGNLKNAGILTNPKSIIITLYALCGFSNFASIGIQIGGIGALAPGQRQTLTELGIKALIGGSIACFMTAAIAAMLL
ncbi:MAG: nucleoside transporter C-terminal domain-containing protein [Saprospiraceae bacterium]|nr:nucleoside transporter C-terminal domain-containing protein [Saprospiraceae bacterium]